MPVHALFLLLCILLLSLTNAFLGEYYFNTTCKSTYFITEMMFVKQKRQSLRAGMDNSLNVAFGFIDKTDGSISPLHAIRLNPSSSSKQSICLKKDYNFFFTPLSTFTGHVLTICHQDLVQLSQSTTQSIDHEVVLVSSEDQASFICKGTVNSDSKLHGNVMGAVKKFVLAEVPSMQPTPPPTDCDQQPTSTPTSMPTLFTSAKNETGGANSIYESTAFISSVTAAGGAGVMTAASASYFVLRNAKNYVKVPMAPSDLAMQI